VLLAIATGGATLPSSGVGRDVYGMTVIFDVIIATHHLLL
jgi:hypothetical protein